MMTVTLVHADIVTLPQLASPPDRTVIVVGPLTFSWTPAVVSAGDSIIEQQLQLNFNGEWGYIFFENGSTSDSYTAPESVIAGFADPYVGHQDTVQWRVYFVGLNDSESGISGQTWSFNILKVPSPWVDNDSWAFFIDYSGGQIPSMNYSTYLQDEEYSIVPVSSGYWWPLDSLQARVYVTLSPQPTLCWTNWQSDIQLTPVDFATGYRVQVSTSQDFNSTVIDTTTQNNSYTTTLLAPGAYYWRVCAQNGGLTTEWSPTEGFIIAEGPTTLANPVTISGVTYYVSISSNFTVSGFSFSQSARQISFNVTASGTNGYCNVTIPTALLGGPYVTTMDGSLVTPTVTSNSTCASLYFTYQDSTHQIEIIGATVAPEFPSNIVLAALMICSVATIIFLRRERKISS